MMLILFIPTIEFMNAIVSYIPIRVTLHLLLPPSAGIRPATCLQSGISEVGVLIVGSQNKQCQCYTKRNPKPEALNPKS